MEQRDVGKGLDYLMINIPKNISRIDRFDVIDVKSLLYLFLESFKIIVIKRGKIERNKIEKRRQTRQVCQNIQHF